MPAISVILTSFNCGAYVGQAIDSIINQSRGDFELLISDDGSTDGSRAVIEQRARQDERITVFLQPDNLGLVRNYNFLLARVRGDLVAIQDADDWSDPRRLEAQATILDNLNYVLCASGGRFHYPSGATRDVAVGADQIIDGIGDDFPSLPASTMFRADLLRDHPSWPLHFDGGTSMDRYFLMDLLDGRKGYHLGAPLYHARVRADSSHRSFDPRKMATHHLFLELERQRRATGTDWLRDGRSGEMEGFVEHIQRDRKLMAQSVRESAVIQVDCGNFAAAARLLAESLTLDWASGLTWRSAIYLARRGIARTLG